MRRNIETASTSEKLIFESVTDPEFMRPRFEEQFCRIWGFSNMIAELRIPKAFPRGKGGFAVQYDIMAKSSPDSDVEKKIFYGRLLGRSEKWPSYTASNSANVLVFNDLRLVVPVFPFDSELKDLPAFCAANGFPIVLKNSLSKLAPDKTEYHILSSEVLGYRLERRCVIRYDISLTNTAGTTPERMKAVVKISRPAQKTRDPKLTCELERHGFDNEAKDGLSVPHIYYKNSQEGITIMEAAPGKTLHDLIGTSEYLSACAAAARILRKLHSLSPISDLLYTAEDEMESLETILMAACNVFPAWKSPFDCAEKILKDTSSIVHGCNSVTWVHRDFYDKQVLYAGHRTTLLDCDNMTISDPALDYANFLAHLRLRQLQAPDDADTINTGMKIFIDAYGEKDHVFESRAGWWEGAALIRLAALYALRPRWRHLPTHLIENAVNILQRINS
jgi:hypothetical protein